MVELKLENVGVEFVLYESGSRSLKNTALRTAVGGLIGHRQRDARTTVTALRDVTLSLAEGDRLAVVGHNGAGKTTLLRVLAGIYHPTTGRALIRGRCVPLFDIHLGVDDEAPGRENILLRGLMMGYERKEIEKRVHEIGEFSGLGGFLDLPVRTYSAGMVTRLLFSIATTFDANILLMDEWLATGDAEFLDRATKRLLDLIGKSEILVLASHNLDMVRDICNRAILLEAGSVVAAGSVDEVLEKYSRNA